MRRSSASKLEDARTGSWMTAINGNVDHLVAHDVLCEIPPLGYVQAVCGDQLLPMSPTVSPGRRCARCRSGRGAERVMGTTRAGSSRARFGSTPGRAVSVHPLVTLIASESGMVE